MSVVRHAVFTSNQGLFESRHVSSCVGFLFRCYSDPCSGRVAAGLEYGDGSDHPSVAARNHFLGRVGTAGTGTSKGPSCR
jgi:hypothetical protein